MKKSIITLNIFIIVLMIFTVISDAVDLNEAKKPTRYEFKEAAYDDYEESSTVSTWLGAALVIAQVVGTFSVVAVVVVTFLRYICCKDPEKKKKLKRSLKIAIIFGIIIFAAVGIVGELGSNCVQVNDSLY